MRPSALLSLVALALAGYALWSVKRVEKRVEVSLSTEKRRGLLREGLISEARGHCQKALRLIERGRAEEADREIEKALSKLREAEKGKGTKERVRDLIGRVEEALRALKEKVEGERRK